MTAYFVSPFTFTYLAGNTLSTAPATNLNLDEPALVWRSNNITSVYVEVLLDASQGEHDTFALYLTNLTSTHTVRVRTATSQANLSNGSATRDVTVSAYSGTAPVNSKPLVVAQYTSTSDRYMRLDIGGTGGSLSYYEASRLLVGKRVETTGVDLGHEQGWVDNSTVEHGPGFTFVAQRYAPRMTYKLAFSGLTEAEYYATWAPFLWKVGKTRSFLFVPDSVSAHLQAQAGVFRVESEVAGVSESSTYTTARVELLSVA